MPTGGVPAGTAPTERDPPEGSAGSAGAHLAADLNAEAMLTVLGDDPLVTELDLH